MPKEKKLVGRTWKKGESGNPKGRPPVPADIRAAQKLNRVALARVLDRMINYTQRELEQILMNPNSGILETAVGAILLKSIEEADHMRLNFILDRLIGRVKDEVEHSFPRPTIIVRPSGEVVELGVEETENE
jgi:uncharacterized protein DUF5681